MYIIELLKVSRRGEEIKYVYTLPPNQKPGKVAGKR